MVKCGLCGHQLGSKRTRLIATATAAEVSRGQVDLGLVIDDANCALLSGNMLLGAVDLKLPIRVGILLGLSSQTLTLNAWLGSQERQGIWIPLSDILTVQIGGPGLIQKGGGFFGGGFGVMGAMEGIALASVLNSLTTRSRVETIIAITARKASLVLLHTILQPTAVDVLLLPLKNAAAHNSVSPTPEEAKPAEAGTRLRQLAGLRDAGLLTDEEYERARRKAAEDLIDGESS
jgi:hypothetical protein